MCVCFVVVAFFSFYIPPPSPSSDRLLSRARSTTGPVGRLGLHSRSSSASRTRLWRRCSHSLTNRAGSAVPSTVNTGITMTVITAAGPAKWSPVKTDLCVAVRPLSSSKPDPRCCGHRPYVQVHGCGHRPYVQVHGYGHRPYVQVHGCGLAFTEADWTLGETRDTTARGLKCSVSGETAKRGQAE